MASSAIFLASFIFVIFLLIPGTYTRSDTEEEIKFGAEADHFFECARNGIHCVLKSGNVIGVIDINGVISHYLELMFEDSYATSDVKCYIPLPWSPETASSLNGSTLHVTLMHVGSTDVLGNFSVPLLFIPDDKDCHYAEHPGSGHGVKLQDTMATELYFDVVSAPVINNTGQNGISYHYRTSSHTAETVNVFANGITVQKDTNFQLYCTRRRVITSMSCFLDFVNVTNIPNGTMIEIIVQNSDGEVVNAIHTHIIKPQGEVQDSPCEGGTSSIKASTLNVQSATEVQPSNRVHSTNSINSSLYFVITSITLGLLVL